MAQLMNHTSGMPDGIYSLLPDREWYTWTMQDLGAAVVPYHSEQELVELSRRLPWEFEPGTGWSYSNVGYVVLSMMLEAATGSRIQDLVRDRVFKPAKMQQSRLEESTLVRGRYLLPYGKFQAGLAPLPLVNPSIFSGAGGVYATAEDITDFTGALMTGRLLRKDLVDAMVTPVGAAQQARYGYGLYLINGPCRTAAGTPEVLIGHDGAGFGTRAVSFTTRDASRRMALAYTGPLLRGGGSGPGCGHERRAHRGLPCHVPDERPDHTGFRQGAGLRRRGLAAVVAPSRPSYRADRCVTSAVVSRQGVHRASATGTPPVFAPGPAARAALALGHFLLGAPDPPLPGLRLLGVRHVRRVLRGRRRSPGRVGHGSLPALSPVAVDPRQAAACHATDRRRPLLDS